MISELYIEKYRGIKKLELKNLGGINIIAGANNVGKTSLLEVIRGIERPNNLINWRRIGTRVDNRMSVSTYESVLSMFPVSESEKKEIKYSGVQNNEPFSIELSAHIDRIIATKSQLEELGGERIAWRNRDLEEEYETGILELEYLINGKGCGSDVVLELQRGLRRQRDLEKVKLVERVVYVSPAQHTKNADYLEEILRNSELYEEFIEIMRMFDPYFVSINSVNNEVGIGRKYVVLSKNHKEGLSLDSYGDGMKKAILLLSAVLRAKNGILLLDEFETAIHVSAMKTVFRWIIETAQQLNVQIFMTSHSLEAIEVVLKCCDEPQNMRMITMVNVDGQVKVRNVDGVKAIQLSDEYGLELR